MDSGVKTSDTTENNLFSSTQPADVRQWVLAEHLPVSELKINCIPNRHVAVFGDRAPGALVPDVTNGLATDAVVDGKHFAEITAEGLIAEHTVQLAEVDVAN